MATEIKEERNQILLEILGRSSLACNKRAIGTEQEVLLEGPARRGDGVFMGRTPANRKVHVSASPRLVGRIVPVRITGASVSALSGELCLRGVDETDPTLLSQTA